MDDKNKKKKVQKTGKDPEKEPEKKQDEEVGEFEDPYEDEYSDEEEDIIEGIEEEGIDLEEFKKMQMNSDMAEAKEDQEPDTKVWLPGLDKMAPDEVLECDSTAYELLHSMKLEWPCLSFDIFPDKLGAQRTKFPMTCYLVTGTQADEAKNNKLLVLKLAELHKTKHDEDSEDEEQEGDDTTDDDPTLEFRTLKHEGAVNRIRVMPQEPHIVATMSDNAAVYLWDVSQYMKALDTPPSSKLGPSTPIKTLSHHNYEGFAINWSHLVKGRLLTGDTDCRIYLAELHNNTTWEQKKKPFLGHKKSVEDLQWSPTESEVFASCSADGTVKIWDCRTGEVPVLSFEAAQCDVNVISWNKKVTYLMASGADDGAFRVWDLRSLKGESKANSIAHFKWHTDQITSIEWDPEDESSLAVSGADDQITIWDLAVERDTETTAEEVNPDIPPQLMFVHQGQTNIKELHYHSQLPGVVISTAEDGFNVFKPSISSEEENPDE